MWKKLSILDGLFYGFYINDEFNRKKMCNCGIMDDFGFIVKPSLPLFLYFVRGY